MYHALFLQFISPTNHIACSQVCLEYSSLQVFNIQCCIFFFFLFSYVKYAILLHFGVMILILEFSCRYIYCLFLSPDIIYSICGFFFFVFFMFVDSVVFLRLLKVFVAEILCLWAPCTDELKVCDLSCMNVCIDICFCKHLSEIFVDIFMNMLEVWMFMCWN